MESFDSENSERPGQAKSIAETLLNLMPHILVLIEPDGTILSANDAACAHLNGSAAAIVGKRIYDLLPSHVAACFRRTAERALGSGQTQAIENGNPDVWSHGRIHPVRDEQCNVVRLAVLVEDTGKRKRDERNLRFLSMITEEVTDAVIATDLNFRITYTNRAVRGLYGYSREELLGKSPGMLNAETTAEQIQSDIYETVSSGRTWTGEALNRRKDGSTFLCEMSIYPLRDANGEIFAYSSVQRDITERKEAQEKLQASHRVTMSQLAELESIYENTPVGLSFVDTDLRYLRINKRLAHMNGKSVAEHIGRKVSEVIPDIDDVVSGVYRQVIESGVPVLNMNIDGITDADPENRHYWLASFLPMKSQSGSVQGVIAVVEDITVLKNAEEQLRIAKGEAEAANIAKSQFLAQMSHEIRTPMSVIMNFADIMRMGELTEEQKSHIELVEKAGKSLMRIIEDIRDFSRIEAGKLTLVAADHSFDSMLNDVESMMRPFADEKGLEFAVVCDDSLPSTVHTDSDRVQQCLLNLIGNAIRFTEKGHVHLKVSACDNNGKDSVRFDVEDTGIGIAADKLDGIFVPFAQVDAGLTRKYAGTGLGLTITKQLAQLLGGDITVTSEIDRGSVFSLIIPAGMETLDADELADKSASESRARETIKYSGKVLLVEDYAGIRALLGELIERFGLEVTQAREGEEALDIALAESFDLIFMDIQMPVMDGYTAAGRLREKGITTPIVALTALALESSREECIEAGCDDYLPKPVDKEELRRILSRYLPFGQISD
ncbi:MAG: PAS domain-containing protein [Planctomycetota bacterium]